MGTFCLYPFYSNGMTFLKAIRCQMETPKPRGKMAPSCLIRTSEAPGWPLSVTNRHNWLQIHSSRKFSVPIHNFWITYNIHFSCIGSHNRQRSPLQYWGKNTHGYANSLLIVLSNVTAEKVPRCRGVEEHVHLVLLHEQAVWGNERINH